MATGITFEGFHPGNRFTTGRRTVTEHDILQFVSLVPSTQVWDPASNPRWIILRFDWLNLNSSKPINFRKTRKFRWSARYTQTHRPAQHGYHGAFSSNQLLKGVLPQPPAYNEPLNNE